MNKFLPLILMIIVAGCDASDQSSISKPTAKTKEFHEKLFNNTEDKAKVARYRRYQKARNAQIQEMYKQTTAHIVAINDQIMLQRKEMLTGLSTKEATAKSAYLMNAERKVKDAHKLFETNLFLTHSRMVPKIDASEKYDLQLIKAFAQWFENKGNYDHKFWMAQCDSLATQTNDCVSVFKKGIKNNDLDIIAMED